jgi:hypothetical protein
MNIYEASAYLKLRYRIRRPHWRPEEFLRAYAGDLAKRKVRRGDKWNSETKLVEHYYYPLDETMYVLSVEDVCATDWEVITTGIKTYFNEYGNLEYEKDQTDWDNYVP